MRALVAVACLGAALCAPQVAVAAAPETAHSRTIAEIQAAYADLVKLQGRDLVIYDADAQVRPFGDAVMGRTWDTVPRNARGSFERIAEATGERRAFSMLVRTDGKVECRVGPTSPDQAWSNLLAAYSGREPSALARDRMHLTSALFQRFVLLHEVGHCTDPHAFDRDRDPMRNLRIRHRAEAYGDTFAILALAREGQDPRALADIVSLRSLYMASSSKSVGAEGGDSSDAAIAGYEHVAYWNIRAMKAAVAIAGRVRGIDDRTLMDTAHAIVDADGVSTKMLVDVHRALAGERGTGQTEAVGAALAAERKLIRSGAARAERTFDRAGWERGFLHRLRAAGVSGDGPAAEIAAERDRLRRLAAREDNTADAADVEDALGRLAELSMKGYASVTDPPVVVSSTGNSTQKIPVAAMPARIDTVGPVPSQALKGALDAATARAATGDVGVRSGVVPLPRARPKRASVKAAAVASESAIAGDMTGISPAMARIRDEAAERVSRRR